MTSGPQIINRILILGNGFDLAVGRRTTYKDFYDSEYCPKDYPAPLIKYLNEKKWENGLENVRWLDLETALQEYAMKPSKDDYYSKEEISALSTHFRYPDKYKYLDGFSTLAERDEKIQHERIIANLTRENRLPSEESIFDEAKKERMTREQIALSEIEQGLSAYLLNEEKTKYCGQGKNAVDLLKRYLKDNYSSIYSFNYTHIGDLLEPSNVLERIAYDAKIHYMHGSLNCGHVIIGAKDGDYGDYDFIQKSFDEEYKSSTLLADMQEANEVDIYGHSLGDCDSQYFKLFFNGLVSEQQENNKNKKRITIYTYDKNSEIQIKKNLNKLTDYRLSWLYSKCNVEIKKAK